MTNTNAPKDPTQPPPVPATAAQPDAGGGKAGTPPTVDAAPGKQGYQTQSPGFDPKEHPVPDWPEGANPPGTNPPKPPKNNPATTPIPGTDPVFNTGEMPDKKNGDKGDKPAQAAQGAAGHAQTEHASHQAPPHAETSTHKK